MGFGDIDYIGTPTEKLKILKMQTTKCGRYDEKEQQERDVFCAEGLRKGSTGTGKELKKKKNS